MSFNSLGFAAFLPLVFLVFHAVREEHRWFALLVASYVFYASFGAPRLLLALLLVSVATYTLGLCMARSSSSRNRRAALWAGITVNLLALGSLRYVPLLSTTGPPLPLAIGVSYYTLQAISYLLDVYAEATPAESHPGYLALYLALFPRLLQGPIERAADLLPQLRRPRPFRYDEARHGLLLFAWGLFKKVMVADSLALYVNKAYGDVHAHAGLPLLLATYGYAAQIYYDFSGYTDMALGTARLFGLRLTQNFNFPYLATSIAEFWRRWHISLSRWLLDYLFMPIQVGLRRWRAAGTVLALLVTFALCGLWHGARPNFIVWGLLHGTLMSVALATAPLRRRLGRNLSLARRVSAVGLDSTRLGEAAQVFLTFNLVCFTWVFFRADTLSDALYVSTHLFSGPVALSSFLLFFGPRQLVLTVAALGLAVAAAGRDRETIAGESFRNLRPVVRWASYYALVATMLWSLATRRSEPFVYFQF
jgi:D-alanyl-lipoteichoic acid acyltransferase DltB (MBOAT superfamily)